MTATATFEVWVNTPTGTRLALLDQLEALTYVRSANMVGQWRVVLPGDLDPALVGVDNVLEIWRTPAGGAPSLEMLGFVRRRMFYDDLNGIPYIDLSGPDQLYLLDSRIVAYAAGTAEASKTDYADDMIKAIVDENLGGSALTARDLSAWVSIESDRSEGESITKGFSWRNVLMVCQDIAAASYEKSGVPLYFWLEPTWNGSALALTFRTQTGHAGADRTYASGAPVVFSRAFNNLLSPVLIEDYSDERNYIYAGGQGLGEDRDVQEASNTARILISPWNRREAFANASGYETSTGVADHADRELARRAPQGEFTADLLSVPGSAYGLDWTWGDKVIAIHQGRQIEAVCERVQVDVDNSGREVVTCKVKAAL